VKSPEPAGGTPADPRAYERQVLATVEKVLRRTLDREGSRERLRDVCLVGSYPDTWVIVTIWDARGPEPRERPFRTRIWGPNHDPTHGVYEPPERAGQDIATRAMGG
jgi:hypothetical protein